MRASSRRVALVVCILVATTGAPLVAGAAPGAGGGGAASAGAGDPTGPYMLRATGRPAAAEYAAARRDGASRAEAARAARSRRAENARRQDAIVAAVRARGLGRVLYRVGSAYNGVALRARRSDVASLRAVDGVQAVLPIPLVEPALSDTVPFIGTPEVWASAANGTGEGISIGVIDTGLDFVHAGFGGSGDPDDLEAARSAAGNPPAPVTPPFTVDGPGGQLFPSAKVVGGFDFAGDDYHPQTNPVPTPDPNPMDCQNHGTHVAGIAAGTGVNSDGSTYTGPYDATTPLASLKVGPGVAPRADLYGLRVFGCNGGTNLVPQALDWALDPDGDGSPADHLDVVNMSLGTQYGSPDDLNSTLADELAEHGVIVVASAGNSSDSAYITGSPGSARQVISVASSWIDGTWAESALEITAPAAIAGLYGARESTQFGWDNLLGPLPLSAPLVRPADAVGCEPFGAEDAALIQGAIPVLDLFPGGGASPCLSSVRGQNVVDAGGVGAIIVDRPSPTFTVNVGGGPTIPMLLIRAVEADTLLAAIADGPVQARISRDHRASVRLRDPGLGDVASLFSSRGPASSGGGLKPDIAAPGDAIESVDSHTGSGGLILAGTSMAAPHVAGAMALLRAARPGWSVEELKAAAMNSAGHDLRKTTGGDERMSPARQGAGRIDVPAALDADVIAYDDAADGEVGVSFGPVQVAGTVVRERTVRVADKGGAGGTFGVGYVPATEVPGVSYSFPDGASVSLPPGGTTSFRVRLTAVAAEMDGTPDPWLDRSDFLPRDTIAEAAGAITLTPSAGAGLRLPIYASLRPVSDMRAEEAEIAVSASAPSAELHLAGVPVDTGAELPRDLLSLVTPFELQAESAALDLPAHEAAADLRYVGVASDARRRAAAAEDFAGSTVWFGLASHERWSSPNVVDFRIEIDADLDDAYETTIHNDSGLPDGVDDWFATTTLDELCPSCAFFTGPLNSLSADQANTAVFDTDVLVLEATAERLGLVEGQRFRYRVKAYARPTQTLVDQVGPLTFDPSAPGLDINGTGFLGRLTTRDLPGETLDVAFDPEAYEADGGLGALLLHHYNGDGARAEVIPLMDDAQPPTSAITYPAANATIPAPAFGAGCATPADDVCGTASDGADGSGVAKVEVQLRRTTDGLYFDGSGWVAEATWIDAAGAGEWTRAFPAAAGYYTIAARATDGAGNVEAPAAARAFRILPATVDPVVIYTGDQSLVQGATATLRAALTSPEPLVCDPAGRPLTFSLDDDPTTATVGDGPYALGSAATNASGVATLTRSTSGWQFGVYTVRVDLAAGSGCTAAFDEATLTVAAAGDAASGGGWYTLQSSGRVNFGFTVGKVPRSTAYRGQVVLINNGKWRYKGTLSTFVKPSATSGSVDGTGTLYRWDATIGDWVTHALGVPINLRFTDNQKLKKVADLFGARIAASATALPNSDPVTIKGGDLKVG